jgi:hypothetical protein
MSSSPGCCPECGGTKWSTRRRLYGRYYERVTCLRCGFWFNDPLPVDKPCPCPSPIIPQRRCPMAPVDPHPKMPWRARVCVALAP